VTSRNRALRLIVMAIVIIGPILLLVVPPLLPHHTQFAVWPIDPASPTASRLDRVWTIVTYVGVAVVVLVGGLMFYAIMTFGHSGPIADDDEPPQIHGNSRLEITWTSIPIVIVAVLLERVHTPPSSQVSFSTQRGPHRWLRGSPEDAPATLVRLLTLRNGAGAGAERRVTAGGRRIVCGWHQRILGSIKT